ncbi:hypothetical protein GCM10028801_30440 [Nocardioides maradonensis]
MPVTPKSATELFDYLQERFGIGTWDETSDVPFFKYRSLEAGKINSICKRRRTSVEELFMAAQYAADQRMVIRQPFDLLKLIAPARRAQKPKRGEDMVQALLMATKEAVALGMQDWASRLYSTSPSGAPGVLAEFEKAKAERDG